MSSDINLAYSISKEGLNMVLNNQATISSGGVRLLNGQMFELAKPAVTDLAGNVANGLSFGPAGSAVSAASSLASNYQLHKLSQAVSHLTTLSYVNIGLSVVNIGICAYGFYKTFQKLDAISDKIDSLGNKIDEVIIDAQNDRLERIDFVLSRIKSYHEDLISNRPDVDLYRVRDLIDEAVSMLNNYIRQFENFDTCSIPKDTLLKVIMCLAVTLSMLIKEFSVRFYYKYGSFPPNLTHWFDVIGKIKSPSVKSSITKCLHSYYSDLTLEERTQVCQFMRYSIHEAQAEISFNLELCQRIPSDQYYSLPNLLYNKLDTSKLIELDDRVLVPIA